MERTVLFKAKSLLNISDSTSGYCLTEQLKSLGP